MPKPNNKPTSGKPEMIRFFKMRAKRKGECAECDTPIYPNDRAVYDQEEKKIFCERCGEDLLS